MSCGARAGRNACCCGLRGAGDLDAISVPAARCDHPPVPGALVSTGLSAPLKQPRSTTDRRQRRVSETRQLAEWLAGHRPSQIPEAITHEAKRALLNYLAAAFGGCRHEAVDIAVRTVLPLSGPATSSLIGRPEKCDPLHATFINGISSHVDDFDDTIPKNYIHATSAVASALFAYASANPISGRDFLQAFVLGFEVTSRVGNVVYPWHYETGWHITSTASVFGAAAAIGKLRKLPADKLVWALGIAATQSAGVRETFGSMAKAMHPGRAGQERLLFRTSRGERLYQRRAAHRGPARLCHRAVGRSRSVETARQAGRALRAARQYLQALSDRHRHPADHRRLHPDLPRASPGPAMIESRRSRGCAHRLRALHEEGSEGGARRKFSIYHAAAIGLVRGRASLDEFTDEVLADADLLRIRNLTVPRKNPAIGADEAIVRVTMRDGSKITKHVEHAVGNLERPMSDADIEEKLRDLARRVIAPAQAERIMKMCWGLERLSDCRDLVSLTRPA